MFVKFGFSCGISSYNNFMPTNFEIFSQILRELDELVVRCPTGLTCETVVHGVTHLGRDIKGIRVSGPF